MRIASRFARTVATFGMTVALLAAAGGPAQAGKSHMGQKPELHLSLKWGYIPGASGCTPDFGFFEVGADGTSSFTEYQLPEGHALVVTDVEWTVEGTYDSGRQALLEIYHATSPYSRVFTRTAHPSAGMISSSLWSDSSSMNTGFEWKGSSKLCVGSSQRTDSSIVNNLNVWSVLLRGYLIKSK